MANNIKVREIITVKGWKDGSGWSYESDYSDKIVEIPSSDLTPDSDMDWSWWEPSDKPDGEDVEITVKYYDLDADPCTDDPIAEWSTWESELVSDSEKEV